MDNYPIDLKKKVSLLLLFKNYLETDWNEGDLSSKKNWDNENDPDFEQNLKIHIKKWRRREECFLFCLTNKIYQANFNDKSQIFVIGKTKTIFYQSKDGEKISLPLRACLNYENPELKRKILYVKKILEEILTEDHKKKNFKNLMKDMAVIEENKG